MAHVCSIHAPLVARSGGSKNFSDFSGVAIHSRPESQLLRCVLLPCPQLNDTYSYSSPPAGHNEETGIATRAKATNSPSFTESTKGAHMRSTARARAARCVSEQC